MNAKSTKDSIDPRHSYQLLSEIDQGQDVSQRELAVRLGVAVGLVNSYLKNLAAKGYVRIKSFPRNRYAYLLTPKGIAEKSRLAYQHLQYYNGVYQLARQDYSKLFRTLEANGVERVHFCGVDEVSEIAYLSLHETKIELIGVYDSTIELTGKIFFGHLVAPLEKLSLVEGEYAIITTYKRLENIQAQLMEIGIVAQVCESMKGQRKNNV